MTYVPCELKEHLVVVVVSESGVSRQTLQEVLVHGYRLLEGGQVLPTGNEPLAHYFCEIATSPTQIMVIPYCSATSLGTPPNFSMLHTEILKIREEGLGR